MRHMNVISVYVRTFIQQILKKDLLIVLALLCCLTIGGCWKKQKHEITTPKTPVYTVSGIAKDRDTGIIMRSVEIVLTAV